MRDWLGRFLLRLFSRMRMSQEVKPFFFVATSPDTEPRLSSFLSTYCPQVRQLRSEPDEFLRELHDRWQGERPPVRGGCIFISYIREDLESARRLAARLTTLGWDVFLDVEQMVPGHRWSEELRTAIRKCHLFMPLISENTERADEGVVFSEWDEAAERSQAIPGRRFIVPVVIDDEMGDPSSYKNIPDEFRGFHFGHAPAGEPDADLLAMLIEEIRRWRRGGAA
jgi:hypothetical protein